MDMDDPIQEPQTKRILIIEDDPVHRRLMESELSQQYDLDFAGDSETAFKLFRGSPPGTYDLIIVDLRLPSKPDGPAKNDEGLKILEALGEKLPTALVVSAYMIDDVREQALLLGVKQVFEKPFSLRNFHEFTDSLLATAENGT